MSAKPILKWAGGKSKLTEAIHDRMPERFKSSGFDYVEPFFGGGAMFFWLKKHYEIPRAVINDVNPDLTHCYSTVKSDVENLISILENYEANYKKYADDADKKKELYYSVRTAFNEKISFNTERAAQLIFLNKTCFNGLYRVNSKGKFNVPIGSYKNPNICDHINLRAASRVLQSTTILNGDYAETAKYAGPETLFYLDPPYKPISQTSSFNAYAKGDFNDDEQIRLSKFCQDLHDKHSPWILSNSDVNTVDNPDRFFDDLYEPFAIERIQASRAINSVSSKRGKLSELLISNDSLSEPLRNAQ